MNLKCMLGFHDWESNCEKCLVCGKTIESQHNWSKDCEKCSKCGTERKNYHHFENEICSICGHASFTDPRDGNCYKIIKIGDQIMFAENLRFKPDEGKYLTYEDKPENLTKFGYLYDWETALKTTVNLPGWHLPTKTEWEKLFDYLGGDEEEIYKIVLENNGCGFNALLAGYVDNESNFAGMNSDTIFWSDTFSSHNEAWAFLIDSLSTSANLDECACICCLSVRLFKD